MRALALLAASLGLFGCSSSAPRTVPDDAASVAISLAEAKAIVLQNRSRRWKDPESIRDAKIGQPYICRAGGIIPLSGPRTCVCIEDNAKNALGGYTGLSRTILMLAGGQIVDAGEPRESIDRCYGLVPFPEMNGK